MGLVFLYFDASSVYQQKLAHNWPFSTEENEKLAHIGRLNEGVWCLPYSSSFTTRPLR